MASGKIENPRREDGIQWTSTRFIPTPEGWERIGDTPAFTKPRTEPVGTSDIVAYISVRDGDGFGVTAYGRRGERLDRVTRTLKQAVAAFNEWEAETA